MQYKPNLSGKSIEFILSKDFHLGLFLILFALIFRIFTYFPTVIDHDESTYIVIANALLNGKTYWVDVIDTKPVGIFLIFGLLQKVFGYAILPIRIFTSVVIGFTGFLTVKSLRLFSGKTRNTWVAGIIYILITSMYTFNGLGPNTEIFFNLFTILSFYLLLKQRGPLVIFLAGCIIGAGFIIKPVVLMDCCTLSRISPALEEPSAFSSISLA